jgi:hypothetical protein
MRKHHREVDVSVETPVARFRSSYATRGPTFANFESTGQLQISIPVPLSILKFPKELRRVLKELQNRRRWDHTTSPSACIAFVSCATGVHRIFRPTFVTIAKREDAQRGASDLPDVTSEDFRDILARWASQSGRGETASSVGSNAVRGPDRRRACGEIFFPTP